MEVVSIQQAQSTSKPNKATDVNLEKFSLVLSEIIDSEDPIIIPDDKEETSNQLLEMMMAYLGLNLPNDNANESIVIDTENQTQGLIDLESLVNKETNINKFPNETLVNKDLSEGFLQSIGKFTDTINPESTGNLENIGNVEQSDMDLTRQLPELAEESLLVESDAKQINNDVDVKTSLNDKSGEKGFQVDDLLQNAEKVEQKVQNTKEVESLEETELKNGNSSNKSFDIENNNSSVEVKDLKTDAKIGIREDDVDLNLIDNSHLKTSNNINKPIVEFKDVKLSNENTQKINNTIIQLVETTIEGDTSLLKVKLYPENLGTVDVTVKMEEGKLTANILVDNEQIKGMFTKSINELNESLIKQNIQIEKINIDLKFDTNPNSMNQSFNNGQQDAYNQNQNNMRNRGFGYYYQNTEPLVPAEVDVYKSGELSILA